jgi:glycerophosphoryl diester phosphodiesterase
MARATQRYARAMSEPAAFDSRWITHRGGGDAAPENTLAAFRTGYAAGFRAFECDVQLSADGVPFLLHDATLTRTAGTRGAAAARRWAELRDLDAGAWFGARFRGEPLASLDAVLDFAAARRVWLNLELKPAPGAAARTGVVVATRVARWQREQPHAHAPLLSSFSPRALRAASSVLAQRPTRLPLALLCAHYDARVLRGACALGATALHLHWRALTPARAREIHAAGLALRVYTVNRLPTARRLWAWGVEGVFTDRLDLPLRSNA